MTLEGNPSFPLYRLHLFFDATLNLDRITVGPFPRCELSNVSTASGLMIDSIVYCIVARVCMLLLLTSQTEIARVCPIFLFSILVYVHARHRVSFQLRDQGIVSRESWATSLARRKLCALLIDPSTGWPRSRRAAPFLNVPALLFVEQVGCTVHDIFA